MDHPPHGPEPTPSSGVRTKAARKTYPRTVGASDSSPAPLSKRLHLTKRAAALVSYQEPPVSPARRASESSETMVSYDMLSPPSVPSTGPLDMSKTRDPAGSGVSSERIGTVPSTLPDSILPPEVPVGKVSSLPNSVTADYRTPPSTSTRK